MRKITLLFAFLASMTMLVSCDEHEPVDLDVHTGYVLSDDGQVLSTDDYFRQDMKKAVAVVFAPQTEEHGVLAVLLDEIAPIAFSDTLGLELGTSCDETAYDGYVNTTAMQNNRDTRTGKGSPLADEAFTSHYFFQSDYIPSVAEMGLLYLAKDRVNPVIERCGGTPLSAGTGRVPRWSRTKAIRPGFSPWPTAAATGHRRRTVTVPVPSWSIIR